MHTSGLEAAFADLQDPRREQGRLHKLMDIIVVAVCAVVSGGETWVDIVDFAEDKEAWLREFLELPNGIPSHDTFARVFQLLDPEELQLGYQKWIRSIKPVLADRDIVPIDGKTMRRSHDRAQNKSAVHLLHAWSVEAGLVLGQRVVASKSNEIPEIPELLKLLSLKGCIVSVDAMGCQRRIANAIVKQHEADYVLALKENQGELHQTVKELFDFADAHHPRLLGGRYSRAEATGKPRGRVERRTCEVLRDVEVLTPFREQKGWTGLQSIVRLEYAQLDDGKWQKKMTRYFISSLQSDAQEFLRVIRAHWHIENKLHRVLDVTFRQDDSRIRVGHSPENFAVLQHIALALLKKHPKRISLRRKRLQAARNDDLRWQIITAYS